MESLLDWLRIPSISAQPDHAGDVRRSAHHVAGLLEEAGLEEVTILETPGAPAVYGQWCHAGPQVPTALVYGHHDVQPVDPIELWQSPPFELVVVDGECRARGAIDDKGQVLYQIEAARGLLRADGRLPVNLKFLIEGEEEVGSPHFEALLRTERSRLACDAVVISDTANVGARRPHRVRGRGLVAFDVWVRTAAADLHSGRFGGAVSNPAHVLARLVSALHDGDGRVALPGFYDDVRTLTAAEEASLAALPFDEDAWMATAGVSALCGEAGRSTLERTGTRPTCDVVGITVGYGGAGVKTIVAAQGNAKVTFRLVADQGPARVVEAFRTWAAEQVGPGVELSIEVLGAVSPALTPADHPAMAALARAIESVWGKAPLLTREGGSGPEESLGRVLDAPLLYLGVGLPGDRIHSPNERMVMDQFWRGLMAAGQLWDELADAKGVGDGETLAAGGGRRGGG